MKLSTEQLANIFAERIGKNVMITYNDPDLKNLNGEVEIDSVSKECVSFANHADYYFSKDAENEIEIKLILTPLKKISDEDCKVLVQLKSSLYLYPEIFDMSGSRGKTFGFNFEFQYASSARRRRNYQYWNNMELPQIQYLKRRGYDLPEFFEINHPGNGKTLIELGIAIDNTTIERRKQ